MDDFSASIETFSADEASDLVGGADNIRALVFASTLIELLITDDDGKSTLAYPRFQFSNHGDLKKNVAVINLLLHASEDPQGVFLWWIYPHEALLNNTPPIDLVDSEDWIDQNAILQQAIRIIGGDDEYEN